jgi:predicted nucleic acid-binding protein
VALICDTGVLYGAMDAADDDHERCATLLATAAQPIVVPSPVMVEVDWLAGRRLEPTAFGALLADVEDGVVTVADLVPTDYMRIRTLCAQYADLPLGFVDAAVAAVAERLSERAIATLDHRHFAVVRPRHTAAFELLPA